MESREMKKKPAYKIEVPMWALTIMQPFASAIMAGHKKYEYRDYMSQQITEFALHAGKSDDCTGQGIIKQLVPDWPDLPRLPHGAVLGIVKIIDVHERGVDWYDVDELNARLGVWQSKYAWELEVVEVFDNPLAARGMPGFWQWYPDGRPYAAGRIADDGTRFID